MRSNRGFTLIELIAFIVVVSIAMVALVGVINSAAIRSVDPVVNLRALECAQLKMDEILARRFDENTPVGGVPACGSAEDAAPACNGIAADSGLDDVGDFNGQSDSSIANCSISIVVTEAGDDLGIANDQARRIDITVTSDGGGNAFLSAYRTNF